MKQQILASGIATFLRNLLVLVSIHTTVGSCLVSIWVYVLVVYWWWGNIVKPMPECLASFKGPYASNSIQHCKF